MQLPCYIAALLACASGETTTDMVHSRVSSSTEDSALSGTTMMDETSATRTTGCTRPGYYGDGCKFECSKTCGRGKVCDGATGVCEGGCLPGWHGDMCSEPCWEGFYGARCASRCSEHCAFARPFCFHGDGTCSRGCEGGWTGLRCDNPPPDHTTRLTYGLAAGLASTGLLAVVLIALLLRRRKASNTSKKVKESRTANSPRYLGVSDPESSCMKPASPGHHQDEEATYVELQPPSPLPGFTLGATMGREFPEEDSFLGGFGVTFSARDKQTVSYALPRTAAPPSTHPSVPRPSDNRAVYLNQGFRDFQDDDDDDDIYDEYLDDIGESQGEEESHREMERETRKTPGKDEDAGRPTRRPSAGETGSDADRRTSESVVMETDVVKEEEPSSKRSGSRTEKKTKDDEGNASKKTDKKERKEEDDERTPGGRKAKSHSVTSETLGDNERGLGVARRHGYAPETKGEAVTKRMELDEAGRGTRAGMKRIPAGSPGLDKGMHCCSQEEDMFYENYPQIEPPPFPPPSLPSSAPEGEMEDDDSDPYDSVSIQGMHEDEGSC